MKPNTCLFAGALLAAVMLAQSAPSRAQSASAPVRMTRSLPDFQVRTMSAERLSIRSLGRTGPWVLVFIDINTASSLALLDSLRAMDTEGEGLVVVAVGSDQALPAFLRGQQAKLPRATWLAGAAPEVVGALRLPGSPAMLAVDAQQGVAWQYIGVPARPENTRTMVQGWLSKSPVATR